MRYRCIILALLVSLAGWADDVSWDHGDITICEGEEVMLSSSQVGADAYRWTTSDASFVPNTTSSSYTGTIPQTMQVTVEALSKERSAENNLMVNGSFESNPPVGFESDYVYKGFDPNPLFGAGGIANDQSGLYVISSSARRSANTFQNIRPHSGNYFMLVDGNKSGDAWRTSTGLNPNLVVEQDSEYVFSYWAANINSQQENGHPARLQFQISLDGGATRTNLGQAFTLPCDGQWHYQEVIYTAPATSSSVLIAVVDLTTHYGVGNDFALDDIMFQPVSGEVYRVVYTDIYHVVVEDCTPDPDPDPEPEPETCEDVVYAKWDDILFVNNGPTGLNGQAAQYAWYQDGVCIVGANEQSYHDPAGMHGTYWAQITLRNGSVVRSCPHTFDDTERSADKNPGTRPRPVAVQHYWIGHGLSVDCYVYEDGRVEAVKVLKL